ncbi:MAG: 50S ribosomal protein L32e [Candidatus Aenigmarchaeota archaeon]|nr:50S ribosomal protein L32e [Candidatus Aenigmarchaeota archaeon]
MKRKIPKFQRHPKLKRVEGGWRKPRGLDNKMRKKLKGKGKMPSIGYGSPNDKKFIHPSGLIEVLVENVKNLENINPKKECIRIRKSVGKKKREEIIKKAKEIGIKILNP